MKKVICFLLCSISFLSLFGCSKKAKSNLDIFIEQFQVFNSDDYKIEDGWYKYTISSIFYDSDHRHNQTITTEFIGDLAFQSKSCSGKINASSLKVSKTIFEENNSTISIRTEYNETYTKHSNLYRLKRTTKDSNIIEEFSEGSNNVEDISFSFLIGTDFNNLLSRLEYVNDKDDYKKIEIYKSTKNMVDTYKLTIEWVSIENEVKRFITDEYYFDDFYHLYKMVRIDEVQSNTPTISSSYTTKVLEECKEKAIEVPSNFDKELNADYKENFNF